MTASAGRVNGKAGGGASVVAVIPVGPGEFEARRVGRVVDALARHEPGLLRVILLIDGVTEAALSPHVRPGPLTVQYVANPRNGRGSGIYDGLACGLTRAFGVVARDCPGAHVWKIDTDALVLRPTSGQIAEYFRTHPKAGMIGTYETNPDGTSREPEWVPGRQVARRYLRPVWYWRTHKKFTSPYVGKARLFARWFRQAAAAGLPCGWHVQGGSYAIGGHVLAAWLASRRLNDPEIWLGCPMSEDVGFTHWTLIDGFGLEGFNKPGQAFGVKSVGLPMPVDQLLAADFGVVHSLKTGDWESECALADELVRRTRGEGARPAAATA